MSNYQIFSVYELLYPALSLHRSFLGFKQTSKAAVGKVWQKDQEEGDLLLLLVVLVKGGKMAKLKVWRDTRGALTKVLQS